MLEKDIGKILERSLSSTADTCLKVIYFICVCVCIASLWILNHSRNQIQALQTMFEYLLDAESQMATDKTDGNVADYSVGAGQSVPVAAGAGDTNMCGGIVQLYWDNILGTCLDFSEPVRQSALKVRT